MRRWNGWGDDSIDYPLPASALPWLVDLVGVGMPAPDAALEQVVRAVHESPLPDHPLVHTSAEDRVQHARGQSLPDWVAVRFGRFGAFPVGVAYPESEDDLKSLFAFARQTGAVLIPYGGGTSVVGHINPEPEAPPAITVDLSRMNRLVDLDKLNRLATFGAGIKGPYLEAALRAQGYTLGHFPQSFEYSTLGGWIATRSSGQQSLHYGRIEDLFAGGRLISPDGTLQMPSYPASAAGPDLRQLVLGSEGRMGIVSQATVRISPLPEVEQFQAAFFHTWEEGVAAVRAIVQARLPLSMLRLSDGAETESMFALAGHERLINFTHRSLDLLGYIRGEKCLVLFGVTGTPSVVRFARREALGIMRQHGGLHVGQYIGKRWRRSRFLMPYLRNSLWEAGYALDTLETVVPWSGLLPATEAIMHAARGALESTAEKVHIFAHLSHLYATGASIYVTYLFRVLPDPDQLLDHWRRMKHAASEAIIAHGGTISHQHGVGTDHAPYLEPEKGALGLALIGDVARRCDPEGLLNPGKLLQRETPGAWREERV